MNCKDWTTVSFDEGRVSLRGWREENARRSEEVLELWMHVISRRPNSLGDEVWLVYEQVLVAALDCSRLDVAQECLQALTTKFPNSMRVNKLRAMFLEAHERYEDALTIYESLIEKEPTNSAFRKRRVAVLLAQNKVPEAIKQLNEYLKVFLNDTEGWLQLCDLYLGELEYCRAAHCMQELILTQPHNHLYHQKFADIKYTQGGVDNVEIAKQYYLHTTKLNPTNLRALYGLVLSCSTLCSKQSASKKKELLVLVNYASQLISQKFSQTVGCNPNETLLLRCIDQIVTNLELTSQ